MTDETVGDPQYKTEDEPGPELNMHVDHIAGGTDTSPIAINVRTLDNIDHIGGETASVGDPEEVDPNAPTTEINPAKAQAMATASDGSRTAAAQLRKATSMLENYGWQARDRNEEVEALGPEPEVRSLRPSKRTKEERAREMHKARKKLVEDDRKDLDARTKESLDKVTFFGGSDTHMLANAEKSSTDEKAKKETDKWLRRFRERAVEFDERAKEIEELAGALHDHPPSQAFIDSSPAQYDYTDAYALLLLEYDSERREEDFSYTQINPEDIEREIKESFEDAQAVLAEAEELWPQDELDAIINSYPLEARVNIKRLGEMLQTAYEDNMTIADVKQRAVDVVNLQKQIEVLKQEGLKRIMVDIRSGRAADPNYKPSEPGEEKPPLPFDDDTPSGNDGGDLPPEPQMFKGSFDPS